MSKSFTSCDSPGNIGRTNTWFTPRKLIEALGEFDLDPCTQSFRPFDTALKHICEDRGGDGLKEDWNGRVWLNPPYGKEIERWLRKMVKHGNGVALTFTRLETRWAQWVIPKADAVNFLDRRVQFLKINGKSAANSAGTGSMLLAFGKENVEAISRVPGLLFKMRKGKES